MRKFPIFLILALLAFSLVFQSCANNQPPAPPTPTSIPVASAPAAVETTTFVPSRVALNYSTKQMEITGTLRFDRSTGSVKPAKVWVWAFFFAPSSDVGNGSWSDKAIEIDQPFRARDEVKITAKGFFHWHDNPYSPRIGVYARTNVSTVSEEAAHIYSASRNIAVAGAQQVAIASSTSTIAQPSADGLQVSTVSIAPDQKSETETKTICQSAPVPSGYEVVETAAKQGCVGVSTLNNAYVVRRIRQERVPTYTTSSSNYPSNGSYNPSYSSGYSSNSYSSSYSGSSGGSVHVRGYYRSNGTYVRSHTRRSPRR